MKNVIEILDRYYQTFINRRRDWEFFLGLADYLNFTEENPVIFANILNRLKREKEKELNYSLNTKKEVFNEFEEVRKRVLNFLKNKKVSKEIKQKIKNLDKFKSKDGLLEEDFFKFNSELTETIKWLWKNNYKSFVNDIIDNYADGYDKADRDADILRCSYFLSPTGFEIYVLKTDRFGERFNIELWGSYDRLRMFWSVFSFIRGKGLPKKTESSDRAKEIFFDAVSDLRTIQYGSSNNDEPNMFRRDKFQLHASRVHNYLIQELSKKEAEKPEEREKINAKAKYSNGILYFRDKEMDFRNKQNQKDLLATLFEDPKKNWYYDEIQEKWDERWEDVKETNPKAKDYWKKFYSAGNDINTAVAIEVQVKDFIIKNTKEIRINPKYV